MAQRFPNQTLTWAKVRKLRKERSNGAKGLPLAIKYGVSRPQVYKIINYKCWIEPKK